MVKQIAFLVILLITLGIFFYTARRIYLFFTFTKSYKIRDFWKRLVIMLKVAIAQKKIFRHPAIGFLHALVFWGFCVILFGSVEMVIDGAFGTDRALSFLGPVYNALMAFGDVFALLITISIIIFLIRRLFMHIKRFYGAEMKKVSKLDANIALTIILLLMLSLLGMNIFYLTSVNGEILGSYPVSSIIADFIGRGEEDYFLFQFFWWLHILLIFLFANILPYSKHFHVFMSVPNVFLTRLQPLGKMDTMESITREVKIMMNPDLAYAPQEVDQSAPERFGVKDINDATWKNYFDSLSCTECGRCTSVCPANLTGKKLSPRKIMMDLRARMKEKGPLMIKNGKDFSDEKSYLRDYISEEEIWACTTCNACAKECPININHPSIILDLRRYLALEEGAVPALLNSMFSNIENNGAPWQFSRDDRMLWAEDITINLNR
jgi:heterodisulfide reductase subunit C